MRKVKQYIIPVITLLVFIIIMNSGEFLKKPFGVKDDVSSYIENMKRDVKTGDWMLAREDLTSLKTAWRLVSKRIQFSVERDEMILIDTNISRIEGAMSIKEKSSILIELEELLGHWNELED